MLLLGGNYECGWTLSCRKRCVSAVVPQRSTSDDPRAGGLKCRQMMAARLAG